jgi:hypothetical protein
MSRFRVLRTAGSVSHVTSISSVILSQKDLRMKSIGARMVCDAAASVLQHFGDGGLFTAAFASRWIV